MARGTLFAALRRALARRAAAVDRGDDIGVNRRAFVRGALATAVIGPSVAGCKPDSEPGPVDRVAIVGAGLAGLHCAARLAEAGVNAVVFEASPRIGGRILTGRGAFRDGQVCELGGELIDSNHATLHALCDELGLTLIDRLAYAPDDPAYVVDSWYIDGELVDVSALAEQLAGIATAIRTEAFGAEIDDAKFAALDAMSLREWIDLHCEGRRTLARALEAAYRGEFGLEVTEQSALNLLFLLDATDPAAFAVYGASDERWQVRGGNDQITAGLAAKLDPAQIRLGTRVTRVADAGDGTYVVGFRGADGPAEATFAHVVFAVPFSVLRRVSLDDVALPDDKALAIRTLGYGTNAKLVFGFSRRAWNLDHAASGAVICDLGVQQTWDSSIGQDGDSGVLSNFLGGQQGVAAGELPSSAWAAAVLPDLDAVWPGLSADYTGDSGGMHWPTYEYSRGSYACYRPGQWSMYGVEGRRERNLHFCGEHTSLDFTGWMEGAAETGAMVAAEILDDLGIAWPTSLDDLLWSKLSVPQACWHGDRRAGIGFATRRWQGGTGRSGDGPALWGSRSP